MNYKLKKFWNALAKAESYANGLWTINLKSFEIEMGFIYHSKVTIWTINLKSFEIFLNFITIKKKNGMNYKLKKFWNVALVFCI